MGENCTVASPGRAPGRLAIGLGFLLGACSFGADPNPSAIASADRGALLIGDTGAVLQAVGAVADEPAMPPAPAGETRLSALVVKRQSVIAVGLDAAAICDPGLMPAFAQACAVAATLPNCSDREVVDLMTVGRADFGLIGGDLSPRELQAGLCQTRLGVELFALTVAPDLPLRSLTRSQMRQILTGEVRDWQKLGLKPGPIVVVAPADRTLAVRAARALIPGDEILADAVRVASERHVVDQLLQKPGAIGIVRLDMLPRESGQKLVQIDWITPSTEAFAFGTYPFGRAVHLITSGQPNGTARQFLDFARGPQGQELLGHTMAPLP